MARTAQAAAQQTSNEEEGPSDKTVLHPVEDAELREREAAAEQTDEQDDGDEDTRLGGADSTEEAGPERHKKRELRREKRHRQKESIDRAFKELRFLRQRNESLERRQSEVDARIVGAEVGNITAQMNDIDSKIQLAAQVLAKAARSDAPTAESDYVEALTIRDQFIEAKRNLAGARQQTQFREQVVRSTPPPVDPAVLSYAQEWTNSNSWYDPHGRDRDSQVVLKIDKVLTDEGYAPDTEDYWNELQARVDRHPALKHRLPTRRQPREDLDDDDEGDEPSAAEASDGTNGKPAPRSGGPRLTSGGRERPLRKNEFYVSPERKAAMISANIWEDPILRKRMLTRYAEYDREARDRARS